MLLILRVHAPLFMSNVGVYNVFSIMCCKQSWFLNVLTIKIHIYYDACISSVIAYDGLFNLIWIQDGFIEIHLTYWTVACAWNWKFSGIFRDFVYNWNAFSFSTKCLRLNIYTLSLWLRLLHKYLSKFKFWYDLCVKKGFLNKQISPMKDHIFRPSIAFDDFH